VTGPVIRCTTRAVSSQLAPDMRGQSMSESANNNDCWIGTLVSDIYCWYWSRRTACQYQLHADTPSRYSMPVYHLHIWWKYYWGITGILTGSIAEVITEIFIETSAVGDWYIFLEIAKVDVEVFALSIADFLFFWTFLTWTGEPVRINYTGWTVVQAYRKSLPTAAMRLSRPFRWLVHQTMSLMRSFCNMYQYLTENARPDKTTLIMADRYLIDEDGLLFRIEVPRQKKLAKLKPIVKRLYSTSF